MRRDDWRLRVQDMLDALAEVQEFTDGLDFDRFSSDLKTVRAIEYNFVVLGEAARSIPPDVQDSFPHLPWSQMIRLRNVVAHQYRRVDLVVPWDTIQTDLPSLASRLRQILEDQA